MSYGVLILSMKRGLSKSCRDSKLVFAADWQSLAMHLHVSTLHGSGSLVTMVFLLRFGVDRLSSIRMSLGRALKARNVPRLEFRLNELSAAQAAVEREFERLARNKGE